MKSKSIYDNLENLQKGKKLKIVFLSHNAYWPEMMRFSDRYYDCDVQIYGDGAFYVTNSSRQIYDCDVIVFYSSQMHDEQDFNVLKDLAFAISEVRNKRVTIGYSSFIKDSKTNKNEYYINFSSISDSKEFAEKINVQQDFSATVFTNLVLSKHDQYTLIDHIKEPVSPEKAAALEETLRYFYPKVENEKIEEESREERKKQLIRLKAALIALTALGILEPTTNTKKPLTRKDIEKARLRKDFDKDPITIRNCHPASTKYLHEANQTLRAAGTYLNAIEKMQTAKQNSEKDSYTYKK